jgi:ferredoxin
MGLDVRVDRARCMGSRCCTNAAEGVFALDASLVAGAVDPAAAPEDDVLAAADDCPTRAISVFRDGTRIA